MPKKKNVKKILIIVVILFALILGVRELALNAIERAKLENKTYTSISDFTSVKEIAKYMGCTYIKEEPSTGEKYDIDIYLKFKYPLYTDEVSNEDYYYKMIALMLEYLNYQNIRLIDQENDIVIAVECDKEKKEIENLLINGEDNYFGTQENLKQIQKYQQLNVSELEIQAQEIKDLISSNWITSQVNFGTPESTFNNYDIYFDEGIEIKTVSKKVFNIVFTEKYNNPVVNGIKVNTSFDEIKNILGEPTFNHSNYIENKQKDIGYIGYKGKDIYVFFSENEISIYRVETTDTSTGLADAIANFNNNAETRSFISAITDMWPDYDLYGYDDDNLMLKYTLRGIKIAFTPSEAGVYVYNNYSGYIADGVTIENIIKNANSIPQNVNIQLDKNLVDLYEEDRVKDYNNYYGNSFVETPDYTTSEFKIYKIDDQIIFLSYNRKYPNSIIKQKINIFIPYSDTEFIYIDEKNQTYKYDATTITSQNLQEDTQMLTVNNKKIFALKGTGIYLYDINNQTLGQILQFQNEVTGIYAYNEKSIIIGIKNMGIYKYDTETNELTTLVEGQAEYNITTIYEDKVFYDDTLTLVK